MIEAAAAVKPLTRKDLHSLEEYAEMRPQFRTRVMEHKRDRRLAIGPNAALYFEDRLTIQYQIQEMLRAERIFEAGGIEEELAAYNPLIPDGGNLKATFMLEYDDEAERRKQLARLIGVEKRVWLQVAGFDRITPFADEDLSREDEDKTSSVHFLRFELTPAMSRALQHGVALSAGIDHEHYRHVVDPVPENVRQSLVQDLD